MYYTLTRVGADITSSLGMKTTTELCHQKCRRIQAEACRCSRVAQNTKHKTKQNKKRFKRTTRSPESVLFVFYFSRTPVFGGNIQRYVTMASIAVRVAQYTGGLKLGSGVGWRCAYFILAFSQSPAKFFLGLRLCGTHFLSLC